MRWVLLRATSCPGCLFTTWRHTHSWQQCQGYWTQQQTQSLLLLLLLLLLVLVAAVLLMAAAQRRRQQEEVMCHA